MVKEVLNHILIGDKELELFRGIKVSAGDNTKEVVHLFFANPDKLVMLK